LEFILCQHIEAAWEIDSGFVDASFMLTVPWRLNVTTSDVSRPTTLNQAAVVLLSGGYEQGNHDGGPYWYYLVAKTTKTFPIGKIGHESCLRSGYPGRKAQVGRISDTLRWQN
jgi:hypothetical protein